MHKLALWLAALGAFLPHRARATTILALDLSSLAREADDVALVRVVEVRARWTEAQRRITSTITLEVLEDWTAATRSTSQETSVAKPRRIVVEQPGGTVGDYELHVFGMPRFTVGDRAVVFLRAWASPEFTKVYSVVGMSQGLRPVRFDHERGLWVAAAPDLHGVVEIGRAGRLQPVDPTTRSDLFTAVPLDELRQFVRTARAGEARPRSPSHPPR